MKGMSLITKKRFACMDEMANAFRRRMDSTLDDGHDFIDQTSAEASEPQWENMKNLLPAGKNNGSWGVDKDGRLHTDDLSELALNEPDTITDTEDNYEWGADEEIVVRYNIGDRSVSVNPQWENMKNLSNGLVAMKKNGLWGFIDRRGRTVVDSMYTEIRSWHADCTAEVVKDGEAFTIDLSECAPNESDKPPIDGVTFPDTIPDTTPELFSLTFSEGVARVLEDGLWGFIDEAGTMVSEPQWECAWPFSEGMAAVKKNGLWGFIDRKGTVMIEPQWEFAFPFFHGFTKVKMDGKYGYIDQTGAVVSEPQWDAAHDFFDGRAQVTRNGKDYYIDINGSIIEYPPHTANKPNKSEDTPL